MTFNSTVGGGVGNAASGFSSTVVGGSANDANGARSTVGGGSDNCADGNNSWAAGQAAKIRPGNDPSDSTCVANSGDFDGDNGTFMWADDQSGSFISTGPRQFAIRAEGGLRWGGTGVNSITSPAYTHLVAASNSCDGGSGVPNSRTYLRHPLLNGNPNAVVLFTAFFGNVSGGSAPPRNPLALYYSDVASGNCPAGRWVIYQTTVSSEAMNVGSRYNIWFVLP